VFGDRTARHVLVMMGDSHAQMWIPALNRIGIAHRLKVIVLFLARCPAATLDVWLSTYNTDYSQCNSQRSAWIRQITRLRPVTVLVTDHTAGVVSAASSGAQPFTSAQWQQGTETTLLGLRRSTAKLAIIGDPVTFDTPPPTCLAANPRTVQQCSVPYPNPGQPGQQVAERAAAGAEAVLYVDPSSWLCTTTCSQIVGNYVVDYDSSHLTCTYAAYLSGVLQASIKTVL
jgi:hypothetical protein